MIVALDLPHTSQGRLQPSLPAGWNLFCHQQIHQNMIMLPFHMVMFRPHWDFGYIRHFGRGWLSRKQDQTWGQLIGIHFHWLKLDTHVLYISIPSLLFACLILLACLFCFVLLFICLVCYLPSGISVLHPLWHLKRALSRIRLRTLSRRRPKDFADFCEAKIRSYLIGLFQFLWKELAFTIGIFNSCVFALRDSSIVVCWKLEL